MRGRPSRTALAQALIATTRPKHHGAVAEPDGASAACTRRTPATRPPAGRRPARLGSSRTPDVLGLALVGREVGARGVDLLEQRLRGEVDGELAGRLDVAQRVLAADRGELDDRRVDARHRVEGVRRQVVHALGRAAADPGDRPRDHDGVEHAVERRRLHVRGVEVHAGAESGSVTGSIVAGRSGRRRRSPTGPAPRQVRVPRRWPGTDRAMRTSRSERRTPGGPARPATAAHPCARRPPPARRPRPRSRPARPASRAARPPAAAPRPRSARRPPTTLAAGDPPTADQSDLRVAVAQRRASPRTSGRRPAGSRRPARPARRTRLTARSRAMSSSTSPRTAACPPARS